MKEQYKQEENSNRIVINGDADSVQNMMVIIIIIIIIIILILIHLKSAIVS